MEEWLANSPSNLARSTTPLAAKLRTGGGRNMDRKHVKDAADKHVLAQSGGRDDFPPLSPAALRRGFFSLASNLAKGGGPEK